MANDHHDALTTGALFLGGGAAGYAVGRWIVARWLDGEIAGAVAPAQAAASPPIATPAPAVLPSAVAPARGVPRPLAPPSSIPSPPRATNAPAPSPPPKQLPSAPVPSAPLGPPTPAPQPAPAPPVPPPARSRPTPKPSGVTGPITLPSQVDAGPVRSPARVGSGPITSPSQVDAGPVRSPGPASSGPITSPSQVDASSANSPARANGSPAAPIDPYAPRATSGTGLSRRFDPLFERYRGGIPIEYLRALVARESGTNPNARSHAARGLMQILPVVLTDYNTRHGTSYQPEHLFDPAINIAIGCELLRLIIASYHRHHPQVANLRADWTNPRFVELLTFGWNTGFSEVGGVGLVASYLERRGITELTIDLVHQTALAAAASKYLADATSVRWCKGVTALYARERASSQPSTP